MRALLLALLDDIRRRAPGLVTLVLVVGIGAGGALAAEAGARRTDSAHGRFVDAQRASDVLVAGSNPFGLLGGVVDLDQVAALPDVAESVRARANLSYAARTDDGTTFGPGDVSLLIDSDPRLGRDIDRWRIVEGRAADPSRPNEATASFLLADTLGLDVGDRVTIRFFLAETFGRVTSILISEFPQRLGQTRESSSYEGLADGPVLDFRIVGIEAAPPEFPPLAADISPPLHLTAAFGAEWAGKLVEADLLYVRLRDGIDGLPAFTRAVEEMAPGESVAFVTSRENHSARVQRATRLESTALRLLGGLLALALVVVTGQAVNRQVAIASDDWPTLRALGFTGRQLRVLALVPVALVGGCAAVLATGTAVALSGLFPIGLARRAELQPGLRFDAAVLVPGALVIPLVLVAVALVPVARRRRRRDRFTARISGLAGMAARAGAPPVPVVGMRFALEAGRGRTAVPVRSTILAVALATALLAGTLTFGSSLGRLLETPREYGWDWDVRAGVPALPDLSAVLTPVLQADRAVDELSVVAVNQVAIEGRRVDAMAVDATQGLVIPPVVAGRPPYAPDEVALGEVTMRDVGVSVGDSVEMRIGERASRVRVVGRAVFPDFGDAGQLGSGALLTVDGLARVLPSPRKNVFLIRLRDGLDREREFERLRTGLAPLPARRDQRPSDLENLAGVGGLPLIGAAVMAALATATVAYALVGSVRRRRRDLALLKGLGMTRSQVAWIVGWQSTTLAVVAGLVAILPGAAAGRWAWTVVAGRLGVVSKPDVPWLALALIVPGAVLVGNVVAALPSMAARRTRAWRLLRAE